MRQGPEFFDDAELDLVFMARRVADALKLEEILTQAGVDYAVEIGTYTGGVLFKRELAGAFFYVFPKDHDKASTVLRDNRMKPY